MAELDLSHYSTAPLYNTKAVVQETGISASTLRAWERRYGVPAPTRTGNNYRLYSEYDMALIRWLRDQIEGGLSISQAVELYRHMKQDKKAIPVVKEEKQIVPQQSRPSYDVIYCQSRLISAFKAFDEHSANQLISELFALFPVEHVLSQIIEPVMIEIGKQWHSGNLSIPVEHFATAYIKRKIMTLINAQPNNPDAPIIITGCAPTEQHELGILFLSLFLQRNGMRVIYLGQNVPEEDLLTALRELKPAMVALSAISEQSALKLRSISRTISRIPSPRPIFAFGGSAFDQNPKLAEKLDGITFSRDAVKAARQIVEHINRMKYMNQFNGVATPQPVLSYD